MTAVRSFVLLAFLAYLALPSAAVGKLAPNGNWVFDGTDYGDEQATKVNDPMTILYMGGYHRFTGKNRETMDAIRFMLEADWPGDMGPKWCNQVKWLRYRLQPGTKMDETDGNFSTSHTCDNQWHTRLWNDKEINAEAQWVVGGVHREMRSIAGPHTLNMSFEAVEARAIHYMRRYCSIRDWRALPGPAGRFKRSYGSFYSNGKISRISMQDVDNSRPTGEKCRGAFR